MDCSSSGAPASVGIVTVEVCTDAADFAVGPLAAAESEVGFAEAVEHRSRHG
jgi:hypothetical protein